MKTTIYISRAHSLGGRVTRSRYKKNFQPPSAHLILDLDVEEVQGNMTTPISDANKVLTNVDANIQDSQVLDVLSNTNNAMLPTSGGPSPMQSKDLTTTPKWLSDSITKKRNVVTISMSMEDAVSKCLGRATKPKRLKVETMISFDEGTKHWTIDIDKPTSDKDAAIASEADYSIERVDLGVGTRAVDVKHLETSTKRIISRTWKDEKDKPKLK